MLCPPIWRPHSQRLQGYTRKGHDTLLWMQSSKDLDSPQLILSSGLGWCTLSLLALTWTKVDRVYPVRTLGLLDRRFVPWVAVIPVARHWPVFYSHSSGFGWKISVFRTGVLLMNFLNEIWKDFSRLLFGLCVQGSLLTCWGGYYLLYSGRDSI